MTTQDGWSRRKFLGATAGTLTGLGLMPKGLWLTGRGPAVGRERRVTRGGRVCHPGSWVYGPPAETSGSTPSDCESSQEPA